MLESEAETEQKLTVVPVELPVDWEHIKEFRDTGVMISIPPLSKRSSRKYYLNIRLEPPVRRIDVDLFNYICRSLIAKNPKLVPFMWYNESARLLARHYRIYRTSSDKSLVNASESLYSFSEHEGMQPDEIVASVFDSEGNQIQKTVRGLKRDIEEWHALMKTWELAPSTIRQRISFLKTWLEVNEIDIGKLQEGTKYVKYPVRAFTEKELTRLVEMGDEVEKVIASILATSGLRAGTLAGLKYKHVRGDLEAGISPLCIHIKAEETKGKYADYYTFINGEAVEYLKLYLEHRRRGSESGKIPPEELNDESPLIRDSKSREVKGINGQQVYRRIHNLMHKVGLITLNSQKRYELNAHSFRKWFKTQMTARGVQSDYVEFFMGHVLSTYQDVKSLGVEELRKVYRKADLSIRPKNEVSKLDQLKAFAETLGLDPDSISYEDGYVGPYRTVAGEEAEISALQGAIRDTLLNLVTEKDRELKRHS